LGDNARRHGAKRSGGQLLSTFCIGSCGSRELPEQVVITTTGIRLPNRIEHALEHAYKGEIVIHFEGQPVRVEWHRDR